MESTLSSSTTAQRVHAKRIDTGGQTALDPLAADMAMARALAKLLDSQFQVGQVRFGLDAILGLVPVVGDLAAMLLGLFPVYVARRHKLGKWLIARMLMNLGFDFVLGATPLVGDAADVLYKAHKINYRMLETAVEKKFGRRFEPEPRP
jgi:hypothetical protein